MEFTHFALCVVGLCLAYFVAYYGIAHLEDFLELQRDRLEFEREQVQSPEPDLFILQPERGPWTAEDAAACRQFFSSPSGRRFTEQLRYSEGGVMSAAIHAEGPADYLRGQAAGYRRLLKDITRLFSPSAERADNLATPPPEQADEA